MYGKITLVVSVLSFVGMVSVTVAAELHVPCDWPTIQAGIDAAEEGDHVVIAPGTYTGCGNRDLDFCGKAITVRSEFPNYPNMVVIDCQGTEAEPHRGFRFHCGETPDSLLSGLTITGGYAPDEEVEGEIVSAGGGIFCDNSSPTITKCTITDNLARTAGWLDSYGGGVCSVGGCLHLNACTISGNVVEGGEGIGRGRGAGVYCEGQGTIVACSLTENVATGYEYVATGLGGGIFCSGNTLIMDCNVVNNDATNGYTNEAGYGGGIHCEGDTTVTNCRIAGNYAVNGNATWGGGGGVYCAGHTTITDCRIVDNSTGDLGGGIHANDNTVVARCDVRGNYAMGSETGAGGGGGIYNAASVKDSTVAANSSDIFGGGVMDCSCITGCTVVGNEAYMFAGLCGSSGPITNCVVWGNVAGYGPDQVSEGSVLVYCCIQDCNSYCADPNYHNIGEDPLFVDADGPDDDPSTWEDNDFRLSPDSPCINAGDNVAIAPTGDTTWAPGEPNAIVVVDASMYKTGDEITCGGDCVLRTVTAVDVSTGRVTFDDPLDAPSEPNVGVENYGPGDLYGGDRIMAGQVDIGAHEAFCCYGDINRDGDVNICDLMLVIKIAQGYGVSRLQRFAADVDGNTCIGTSDIDLVAEYILEMIASFPVERMCGDRNVVPDCGRSLELTVWNQDMGTVTVEPDHRCYEPNTVVTLTAHPNDGATFGGWFGDVWPQEANHNPITITMKADREIVATFYRCGSFSPPLLAVLFGVVGVFVMARRRR